MTSRVAVAVTALAVAVSPLAYAPVAHAGLDCVHRSREHIEHHGGVGGDSAWHVAHGQPATCDPDKKDEHCTEERRAEELCDDQLQKHADEHHEHESDDEPREVKHEPSEHGPHEHADEPHWHRDHVGPHRDPHPLRHGIEGLF